MLNDPTEAMKALEGKKQWNRRSTWTQSCLLNLLKAFLHGKSFFLSCFFLVSVAFQRVALETPEWTCRDSNHRRQSVSAGKTNAIPTEPSGRLFLFFLIGVAAWVDSFCDISLFDPA